MGNTIEFKTHEPEVQNTDNPSNKPEEKGLTKITTAELSKHNTKEDCWVAIGGKVYDLTFFIDSHTGGPESILHIAGRDGTVEFEQAHVLDMMGGFDPVGEYVE